jgi:hypothetical protein
MYRVFCYLKGKGACVGCEHVFLQSVEGNGIGAVAVHPARKNFAVCEKGVSPNIYIYNYPSLELYKVNISLSLCLCGAVSIAHFPQTSQPAPEC